MKVDIEHAPQLRHMIDTLLSDISVRQAVEKIEPKQFRVTSPEVAESFSITKDELVAVYQSRIEDGMKQLSQRYQIDFSKANVNALAPSVSGIDVSNITDGRKVASA